MILDSDGKTRCVLCNSLGLNQQVPIEENQELIEALEIFSLNPCPSCGGLGYLYPNNIDFIQSVERINKLALKPLTKNSLSGFIPVGLRMAKTLTLISEIKLLFDKFGIRDESTLAEQIATGTHDEVQKTANVTAELIVKWINYLIREGYLNEGLEEADVAFAYSPLIEACEFDFKKALYMFEQGLGNPEMAWLQESGEFLFCYGCFALEIEGNLHKALRLFDEASQTRPARAKYFIHAAKVLAQLESPTTELLLRLGQATSCKDFRQLESANRAFVLLQLSRAMEQTPKN